MSQVATQPNLGEKIHGVIANLTKALEKNEKSARDTFSVKSELTDGLKTVNKIRQFEVVSDEPKALGGTDTGPNPVELVLASLASCQEIVLSAYAHALGIPFQKITVDVEGDLDLRGFFNLADVRPGFDNIRLKTTFYTDETNQENLDKLKHLALNNCPVLDIIKNPVPVSESVEFKTL